MARPTVFITEKSGLTIMDSYSGTGEDIHYHTFAFSEGREIVSVRHEDWGQFLERHGGDMRAGREFSYLSLDCRFNRGGEIIDLINEYKKQQETE